MAEIKKSWTIQFNERGFPHVQQAFVLPPDMIEEADPFILLAEDWFKRGTFGDHPHKGFQTITYVIDGRLEHIDNKGGRGILSAGDVQYMNAGSGARHAEEPVAEDIVHSLQLWLNLPASLKQSEPFYQDIYSENVPVTKIGPAQVRVFAGNGGPMKPLVPFTMAEISLPAGEQYTHKLEADHTAFFYVLGGRCAFGENETVLEKGQAALLTKGHDIQIKSEARSKVLIYSGKPHGDPIITHGPFVMNTQQEIREAFLDYQSGKFGPEAK
ncbi:pirin family protein [Domibacillus sp. A3M-37]|uniref:pirin family protein n=1 Tax=Domibacillus sp. A3M-37 TaxID=2962037 RepID=UPI0020B8D7AD|nr:pirin-like C-terminal cupin domain-containing protein [Domibacillus sp. A3M-37]MCP3761769.1 pirin family protein [Domibacillus sp. A3M-37]